METKTIMRQTNEQRGAMERLRAVAGPYRVTQDIEGWPVIEGRLGRIEYHDGLDLAVFTDRPRMHAKILAIQGLRRHQSGDTELRALFHPNALLTVASAIKARRRRHGGASPEVLARARQKARPVLLGAT